jgi:flagellar biosynthesis anti-sigma factor FlgM
MDIRNIGANSIARTYTRQVGTAADGAPGAAGRAAGGRPRTDSVDFSGRLQEMNRVKEAAAAAPEVRADRVAELKARIAANTYTVDSQRLAAALLG